MMRPRVRRAMESVKHSDGGRGFVITYRFVWAVVHADGEWSPYIVASYPLHEWDKAVDKARSLVGREVCS